MASFAFGVASPARCVHTDQCCDITLRALSTVAASGVKRAIVRPNSSAYNLHAELIVGTASGL